MSPPPKKTPGAERRPSPSERRPEEVETSEEAREERQPRGRAPSEERAAAEDRLPSEESTMPTRKALVVGVNDYGGPPNDLPSCVNDANAITELLESRYGFKEVHTLRDAEATVARIEDELTWLAKGSRPDDRLVFYFSGHGHTKLVDGVMEEFLVLRDGLFDDNRLVNKTRDLAPGTLTVILDTCFSGGTEKKVFDPTGAIADVELAQVKAWNPPREEAARDKGFAEAGYQTVREFRRFGCSPLAATAGIARTLAIEAFASRASQSAPTAVGTAWLPSTKAGTEAGQLELNGLLLAACLETETAVASTSKTERLSAFTHALLRAAERLGASASTADVLTATENHLKMLGVRQTPLVLERATPGTIRRRSFITLEATTTTDNLGYLSEPRFWEGVLTAMTPHVHALRAIYAKEGELMSTMYQPTLPNYQGMMGGYQPGYQQGIQPSFGFGQPSPEDVQRLIPVLGPILATVIPAVVPPIVNSIFSQQRALTGGFGTGTFQQTSPEDVQRLLPVLGPVLANVLPAVLPQIINNVLAQQKMTTPWGGQQLGGQQLGGQQLGGQQLGGAQFGAQPLGWGIPQGGQDLTQTVSQSVNEALRRVGIQPTGFGTSPGFNQSPVFGGRY